MKCFHIALLLTLALSGKTTGALAADDGAVASQRRLFLPPDWPETLRPAIPLQSRLRNGADALSADSFSLDDLYYVNGPSSDKSGSQADNRGPDNDAKSRVCSTWTIGARLGCCIEPNLSQVAVHGKTAAAYAWQYCQRATAFVCERQRDCAEAKVIPHGKFGRLAKESDIARVKPVRSETVEFFLVTSCNPNNRQVFATLGRVAEYRLAPSLYATLSGGFCRLDTESCNMRTPTAEFAMPREYGCADSLSDSRVSDETPMTTSAATARFKALRELMNWWLGGSSVVFRNILHQIARLDWTVLLSATRPDLATGETSAAPGLVAR